MIQYKHLLNPLKEKSKLHEREREREREKTTPVKKKYIRSLYNKP